MPDALIGHTGFVGGNLTRQRVFHQMYNSTNIEEIEGGRFELVVCAGVPGAKWKANREPERDFESIERLMTCLERTLVDHVVLISTVDVYPIPVMVDEGTTPATDRGSPYGRHRLHLERFVQSRFESTTVRLPGLFGPGLKKNVIYDLLHDNRTEAICPDSEFQFYPLERLWDDIEIVRRSGIGLANLVTEPKSVRAIAAEAFEIDLANPGTSEPVRYDVRTRHASAFGRNGPYLLGAGEVVDRLKFFVAQERER